MRAGRTVRLALAVCVLAAGLARAIEPVPTEVRVLSAPGTPTVVRVQASPDTAIDDRTPGAHPPSAPTGPASTGETFTDEVTLVLRGRPLARPAAIDVADELVSTIRLFPDPAGTQVVVFVRQPVTYDVARPTATGEIALTLRPRTVAAAQPAAAGARRRRPALHEPSGGESEQVQVDAEELHYDQQNNVLTARGSVTLTRGATRLRADEVTYDRTNGIADAKGHVILVDPEATVEGDAAHLNLNDETGWVKDVYADMKQSPYRLTGDHLEKHGGPCYSVTNGVFTTCRCGGVERPSWSLAGANTEVTLGGTGVTKSATFRVSDVPVLWFPYMIFPANTDRQSGLLFPRLGYSNRRGFVYEQPFYWAIDKSSDATLALDLETNTRVGGIGEYRYIWPQGSRGIFTAGYFNDSLGGTTQTITPVAPGAPSTSPVTRWVVAGHHTTPLDRDTDLYLDVLRVSDPNVLREIRAFASTVSSDIQVRSTRYTTSHLGFVRTWDGGLVQVDAKSYQDLFVQDMTRLTLDQVPRVAAEHEMAIPGTPLVGHVATEAVDFQRAHGYDGLRADIAPDLLLPFHLGQWVFGSVRGQVRETAYHLTDTQQVAVAVPLGPNGFDRESGSASPPPPVIRPSPELPNLATDHTREIGQVNGRLGTEFARVLDFPHFGLDKIRHSIEPELQYLFVPAVDRNLVTRQLPSCFDRSGAIRPGANPGRNCAGTLFSEGYLFDETDAINRRNFVSYGFTTRIVGRGALPTPGAAPSPAPPAPTVGESEESEEPPVESIEELDPDTIPQGLPASAVPSFAGPPPPPSQPGKKNQPTTPGTRELARFSILQGFDVARNLTGNSRFSDIDAQLRATPVDWAGISYGTTLSTLSGKRRAQAVGIYVREPGWSPPTDRPNFQNPTTLGVSYRFIGTSANSEFTPGTPEARLLSRFPVEEVDGTAYLRLGDYYGIALIGRYSLADTFSSTTVNGRQVLALVGPRFIEEDALFRVVSKCNCWVVDAGVTHRADLNDTTFRVQFTLYGLGSIGQPPLRHTYAGLAGLQNLGFRRPWTTGTGGY